MAGDAGIATRRFLGGALVGLAAQPLVGRLAGIEKRDFGCGDLAPVDGLWPRGQGGTTGSDHYGDADKRRTLSHFSHLSGLLIEQLNAIGVPVDQVHVAAQLIALVRQYIAYRHVTK